MNEYYQFQCISMVALFSLMISISKIFFPRIYWFQKQVVDYLMIFWPPTNLYHAVFLAKLDSWFPFLFCLSYRDFEILIWVITIFCYWPLECMSVMNFYFLVAIKSLIHAESYHFFNLGAMQSLNVKYWTDFKSVSNVLNLFAYVHL